MGRWFSGVAGWSGSGPVLTRIIENYEIEPGVFVSQTVCLTSDGEHLWMLVVDGGDVMRRYTFPGLVPVESVPFTSPTPVSIACRGDDVYFTASGGGPVNRIYAGKDPDTATLLTTITLAGAQNGIGLAYNASNDKLYALEPGGNASPFPTARLWEVDPDTGSSSMVYDSGITEDNAIKDPTVTPDGVVWMQHNTSFVTHRLSLYDHATATGSTILIGSADDAVAPTQSRYIPQPDSTTVFEGADLLGHRRHQDGTVEAFPTLDPPGDDDFYFLVSTTSADGTKTYMHGDNFGYSLAA